MKTITITQADVDLAYKEMQETHTLAVSCVVFQALKREGVPVTYVGISYFKVGNVRYEEPSINPYTEIPTNDWPTLVGKTFTTTYL